LQKKKIGGRTPQLINNKAEQYLDTKRELQLLEENKRNFGKTRDSAFAVELCCEGVIALPPDIVDLYISSVVVSSCCHEPNNGEP